MGQAGNSGRNASLDSKKQRAAGRLNEHGRHAPTRDELEAVDPPGMEEEQRGQETQNEAGNEAGQAQ